MFWYSSPLAAVFVFLMIRRPPRSTRTDTLVPYTTLFRSNFVVARAAALHMRENDGGSIVNLSSELAHIGMGYYVHYCAAKAGVVGLTMALAAEMAPTVRVNSVSPGPIDTPMLQAEIEWFSSEERRVGKECVSTYRSR